MDDVRAAGVQKEPGRCRRIREIRALETETRMPGQARETRLLQCDLVIRIEAVDADDRDPLRQETLGRVHPDETSAAGDEDVHAARRSGVGKRATLTLPAPRW
jgi:hypothetical protein